MTVDEKDGKENHHYYGHAKRGRQIVEEEIVPDLSGTGEPLSQDEVRRLLFYVECHDDRMSLKVKSLRKYLKAGFCLEEFQTLMKLEVADAKAHRFLPIVADRIEVCEKLAGDYAIELYQKILTLF